jgi:hypothetical protein
MEKYHGFESWLKANKYDSWKTYLSFMRQIEKSLMSDIEKITSVSILRKLMADLENNRSFAARSKSDRDNILSGFRTYILYIGETKKI